MRWIDSPAEIVGKPVCYCEPILIPDDLMLQARPIGPVSSSSSLTVKAYKVSDGSLLADITTSIVSYFGTDSMGNRFFNLKLKNFPGAICDICFYLEVTAVTGTITMFHGYTDIYCIKDCCAIPRDVTFQDDGVSVPPSGGPVVSGTGSQGTNILYDDCGYPYLRLEGDFNCYDAFTGEWYGSGGRNPSGTPFQLKKSVVMRATLRPLSAVVVRTVSEFCRVQKATYTEQYDLQSFDMFPAWKKAEIEMLLCAPSILVNGETFTYAVKEEAFSRVFASVIDTPFKFRVTLGKCMKRQIFGCNDCDVQPVSYYALARAAAGTYINDVGQMIATDKDSLINYFTGINGVVAVTDEDISSVNGPKYALIKVESYLGAQLPSFIYLDKAVPPNRVYARNDPDGTDPNTIFGYSRSCSKPVTGTITFAAEGCPAPEVGTITFALPMPVPGVIDGAGDWVKTEGYFSTQGSKSKFRLVVNNPSVTLTTPETDIISYAGELIGQISIYSEGLPSVPRYITHTEQPELAVGTTVQVNPDGTIIFSGNTTGHNESHPEISLPEIIFDI